MFAERVQCKQKAQKYAKNIDVIKFFYIRSSSHSENIRFGYVLDLICLIGYEWIKLIYIFL
jgi:hypothetical protein